MITVTFNTEILTLEKDALLSDVLAEKKITAGCFALSLNRCFLPKSQIPTTILKHNDLIEIITPMQGG